MADFLDSTNVAITLKDTDIRSELAFEPPDRPTMRPKTEL
jgi:hypothetical protein